MRQHGHEPATGITPLRSPNREHSSPPPWTGSAARVLVLLILICSAVSYGATIVDFAPDTYEDPGWPFGGVNRRVMDSMGVTLSTHSEFSTWQDGWYSYMPDNRVTYNSDVLTMKWFFGTTDSDTTYYPIKKVITYPWIKQTQFFWGYASVNGFANPQLALGRDINGVWIPLETEKYGLTADKPCHIFGLGAWRYKEFMNVPEGQVAAFDGASVLRAVYDLVPVTVGDEVWRFAVQNGSQWYMSEASFKNQGARTLDNFNNNSAQGKRWAPFYPTAREYRMPDSPVWQAVNFDNVTAIGFAQDLLAYGDFYRLNAFSATGNAVAAKPWVRFDKSQIRYLVAKDGANPSPQSMAVLNGAGSGLLGTITAVSNAAWLSPQVSGTSITNNVDISQLPGGSYYATVTVTATGTAAPAVYGVYLKVLASAILTDIVVDGKRVAPGSSTQFTARGRDQFGQPLDLSNIALTWSTSGGGTIDAAGVFTAGTQSGSFNVTASVDGVSATATVVISSVLHKVNVGGAATGDWLADRMWGPGNDFGYTGGAEAVGSAAIAGTDDDIVFQSVRHGADLGYRLKVPNGRHTVTLLFAEHWRPTAGTRVFGVAVEGVAVEPAAIDVTALVGQFTALSISAQTTVADGILDITFTPVVGNPIISGIVVEAGEVSVAVSAPAHSVRAVPVRQTVKVFGLDGRLVGKHAAGPNASYRPGCHLMVQGKGGKVVRVVTMP